MSQFHLARASLCDAAFNERALTESKPPPRLTKHADLSAFIPHRDCLYDSGFPHSTHARTAAAVNSTAKTAGCLHSVRKAETLLRSQSDQLQNVISCKSPQLLPRIFTNVHPGSITFTATCRQDKTRQIYSLVGGGDNLRCVSQLFLCLLFRGQNRCNIILAFTTVCFDFQTVPFLSTVTKAVTLFTSLCEYRSCVIYCCDTLGSFNIIVS